MTLTKWRQPNGTTVTFEDRRPDAKTADPDNETLAATFEIITTAMADTPGHEGRHAAVAMLFDFKTVEAHAAFPSEDGILGRVTFDFTDEAWDRMRLAEEAVVLLAGPVGEKAGPPAWPPRVDDGMAGYSDEKQLAHIVHRLKLNEKQYNGLVDIARTITRHPGIKRVEERIGTLLSCGLTLNGRMLKDLHDSAWREIAEENRPCTQEELEDAELREHFRGWMTSRLEDGARYYDEQAKEKAARDLRRRCDQLAREVEHPPDAAQYRGSTRTSVFPATFKTH
jgi:hypothetical protein